jgi:hypothetical protein
MPRTINITITPDKSDALIQHVKAIDGVKEINLQKNGSVVPPGDVITVTTTNSALTRITLYLFQNGIGGIPGTSLR